MMRKIWERVTNKLFDKLSRAVKQIYSQIQILLDFCILMRNFSFFSEQSQKALTFTLDFHVILFSSKQSAELKKKTTEMTGLSQLKGQSPVRRHIKFEFIITEIWKPRKYITDRSFQNNQDLLLFQCNTILCAFSLAIQTVITVTLLKDWSSPKKLHFRSMKGLQGIQTAWQVWISSLAR